MALACASSKVLAWDNTPTTVFYREVRHEQLATIPWGNDAVKNLLLPDEPVPISVMPLSRESMAMCSKDSDRATHLVFLPS